MALWTSGETISTAKINQKTIFVGTSAPATTYAGQVYFESDANVLRVRNGANDNWINVPLTKTDLTTLLTVDPSAFLLKTTKVTDLATIWDKTTKIAYADTAFADQSLKTTDDVTFDLLNLTDELIISIPFAGNDGLTVKRNTTEIFRVDELGASYKACITLGGDANLYRDAANELKTDDGLTVSGSLTFTPSTHKLWFGLLNTDIWTFAADYTGSTTYPLMLQPTTTAIRIGDGYKITWGSIGSADDVNLYRSAANNLKTDDFFHCQNVTTYGTYSGFCFADRTTSRAWQWYGSADVVYLHNGSTNVLGCSAAGDLYATTLHGAHYSADETAGVTAGYGVKDVNGNNVIIDIKNGLIVGYHY